MPSLQKSGESWYCQLSWQNRRYRFGVFRVAKPQAEATATKAGEIVEFLERGVQELPEGVDAAFVKYDGHPQAHAESQKISQKASMSDLRDGFLKAHEQAQEARTLVTARIRLDHLVETLGTRFDPRTLELSHLSKHVDRRGSEVSLATASKEILRFHTPWIWSVRMTLGSGPVQLKELVYLIPRSGSGFW